MTNAYQCEYGDTVEALAAQHSIAIEWGSARRGRAWRKTRRVRIAYPTCSSHFAIALHEIGHIVGKTGATRLEKEYNAWRWAVDNTPVPFDDAAWLELHACLRSYVTWAQQRQFRKNVRPVIPPKDHPMWSLLATAKENF